MSHRLTAVLTGFFLPRVHASLGSAPDYKALADSIADVVIVVGPDRKTRFASSSVRKLFGREPEEMIGLPPDAFVLPQDMPVLAVAIDRKLQGFEDGTEEIRIIHSDGRAIWVEGNARVVRDRSGKATGEIIVVLRDLTERKRVEHELSNMALVDALTGLANRRAFDLKLREYLTEALQQRSELSLLIMDLDHFKDLNDRYGHQVGDDCLRTVAAAIRLAVRPEDVAARYGGEEIAVVLSGAGVTDACREAERLRAAVENLRLPHERNPEGDFHVTVSVGVATVLPRAGASRKMPEALIEAADRALYQAKREGRNRVATGIVISDADNASAS